MAADAVVTVADEAVVADAVVIVEVEAAADEAETGPGATDANAAEAPAVRNNMDKTGRFENARPQR